MVLALPLVSASSTQIKKQNVLVRSATAFNVCVVHHLALEVGGCWPCWFLPSRPPSRLYNVLMDFSSIDQIRITIPKA